MRYSDIQKLQIFMEIVIYVCIMKGKKERKENIKLNIAWNRLKNINIYKRENLKKIINVSMKK